MLIIWEIQRIYSLILQRNLGIFFAKKISCEENDSEEREEGQLKDRDREKDERKPQAGLCCPLGGAVLKCSWQLACCDFDTFGTKLQLQ